MDATTRRAYERRRQTQGILIAAASTLVVLAAAFFGLPKLSGWQRVRDAFFDWNVFRHVFPGVLRAFWTDVWIFLLCAPAIVIVGMTIAVGRNARAAILFPLRLFAMLYTDIVRGVPVILWITLIGFGVPGLLQTRDWYGRSLIWGAVALVMCYSAYVGEVFRAGIESVHESQRAAARSLGMSTGQTMRSIILPQAVRRVVPPLMNDLVSLQKDVALISVLGPVEALRRAGIEQSRLFDFTPYVAAAVLFLCVSVPLTRITDHLMTRERRLMNATAVR